MDCRLGIKLICIVICCVNVCLSKGNIDTMSFLDKISVVSFSNGVQISGIKPEDFVASNVSPIFSVNTVYDLTKALSIQLGFKGFYFLLISDDHRHYYNFLYLNLGYKLNNIIRNKTISASKMRITSYTGCGYFYNYYYDRPNICLNLGLNSSLPINDNYGIIIDISSIIGWDIYQGNEDILPSVALGINYKI